MLEKEHRTWFLSLRGIESLIALGQGFLVLVCQYWLSELDDLVVAAVPCTVGC